MLACPATCLSSCELFPTGTDMPLCPAPPDLQRRGKGAPTLCKSAITNNTFWLDPGPSGLAATGLERIVGPHGQHVPFWTVPCAACQPVGAVAVRLRTQRAHVTPDLAFASSPSKLNEHAPAAPGFRELKGPPVSADSPRSALPFRAASGKRSRHHAGKKLNGNFSATKARARRLQRLWQWS